MTILVKERRATRAILAGGATPGVLAVIAATALAIYVCFRLASPFLLSITWAVALAVLTYPLHNWLFKRIEHGNLAAISAVVLIAAIPVAPDYFLRNVLPIRRVK